jgi:hypothetical protein
MSHEHLSLLFWTHSDSNSMMMNVMNSKIKPLSGLKTCETSVSYFKDYLLYQNH